MSDNPIASTLRYSANLLATVSTYPTPTERNGLNEFLLKAADEVDRLERQHALLRSAFRVNMILANPAMSHAEIDKAMEEIAL